MIIGLDSRHRDEKILSRRKFLFEGDTKSVYEGTNPDTCVLFFKDQHPIHKEKVIHGKGIINNKLSTYFLSFLARMGIENHFIEQLNMREQNVRATESLPFYLEIHNYACDDFVHKFNLCENSPFTHMLPELHFKNKNSGNPEISIQHLISFGLCDEDECDAIFSQLQRINDLLMGQFLGHDLALLRYKLEFGRIFLSDHPMDTRLLLMDEISLDTCRVFDLKHNKRLDILHNLEKTDDDLAGYMEMAQRFNLFPTQEDLISTLDLSQNSSIISLI